MKRHKTSGGAITLEAIADRYRRQGYSVQVSPMSEDLPTFLRDVRPDLIARKGNDQVVVEVKRGDEMMGDEQLVDFAKRVEEHGAWRLDLVVTPAPRRAERAATRILTGKQIALRLSSARQVLRMKDPGGALLLGWSALEAALTNTAWQADLGVRGRPPLAVIKAMYVRGILSWAEHQVLYEAGLLRNRIAHGVQTERISQKRVEAFLDRAETLLSGQRIPRTA